MVSEIEILIQFFPHARVPTRLGAEETHPGADYGAKQRVTFTDRKWAPPLEALARPSGISAATFICDPLALDA